MLLILLSLFSYDLVIASEDNKVEWLSRLPFNNEVLDTKPEQFNDSLLIKQFRKNFIKVKNFIEDAEQQFNKDKQALSEDLNKLDETKRNNTQQYYNKTFSLRGTALAAEKQMNTGTPILYSKSRPVFPFGITPHTTEKNGQHLKWEEIFPDTTGPSKTTLFRLRNASVKVESPLTAEILKTDKKSGPYKPIHANTTSESNILRLGTDLDSIRSRLTVNVTKNDEIMRIWLQSVTTDSAIEKWMDTLKTESGITRNYEDKATIPITNSLSTRPTPAKKYQTDSKKQPLNIKDRHSISLPGTPTEDHFGDSATKRDQLAEDARSFHLRTGLEKNEAVRANAVDRSEFLAEQDQDTQKESSSQNRRSHQRKRKHHSHKPNRKRQGYRHPKYSNQGVDHLVRQMKKTIEDTKKNYSKLSKRKLQSKQKTGIFLRNDMTRSIENTKETYPNPKIVRKFHIDVIEKDMRPKSIKRRDDRHKTDKKTNNKISLYEKMKELLKEAHSKKKEKQLKLKAELLRKIREDSNYIDEEMSLRKNLVQALRSERKENNEIKRLFRK